MTIRTSIRTMPAQLFGSSGKGKIQERSCALILADHEIATKMIMRLRASTVLMGFLLASCILAQSQAAQANNSAVANSGAGFVSMTAKVNGTTFHYVRGGTGPGVILLHGFPEDWCENHRGMPLLAKHFTTPRIWHLNAGVKGPWLPHVMFLVPEIDPEALGSDLGDDVPLDAHEDKVDRFTVVDVLVSHWSDGTPASADHHCHPTVTRIKGMTL